jgi:hypothetical protein
MSLTGCFPTPVSLFSDTSCTCPISTAEVLVESWLRPGTSEATAFVYICASCEARETET